MKKVFFAAVIVIVSLLNVSCSKEHYPPIQTDAPLMISVNIKDNTVSFIDIEKMDRIGNWEMKKSFTGGLLFPDGDTLLLYGKHQEKAVLYSLTTGKEIDKWKVGTGIVTGMVLANKKEIVFSDQEENRVRFFTLDGKEVRSTKTNDAPITLLEDEQTNNLYTFSHHSNQLVILDRHGEKIDNFPIHDVPTGGIIANGQNEIWIGGHGKGIELEEHIHVYDRKNGRLLKKIHAPTMPINFVMDDEHIYAISHGSNSLYKFNREGELLQSLTVGANPFAIEIFNNYLFIAGYDSNDIQIVDQDRFEIIRSIDVGKGPFQLILRERQK